MTKIRKARYKFQFKKIWHFNSRKIKIRLSLHKLNILFLNTLINQSQWKNNKKIRSQDTFWRLKYKWKQEIKAFYGDISESTFKKLNKEELLISNIETRLDVIIYRLNWALSIYHAKQLINQGHLLINGKKIKIPSYRLKEGDIIEVSKTIESRKLIKNIMKEKLNRINLVKSWIYKKNSWLGWNNLSGKLEYLIYIPLSIEVDYISMSAILIFKNENERRLMYKWLK